MQFVVCVASRSPLQLLIQLRLVFFPIIVFWTYALFVDLLGMYGMRLQFFKIRSYTVASQVSVSIYERILMLKFISMIQNIGGGGILLSSLTRALV